jgi:hypothetical protein
MILKKSLRIISLTAFVFVLPLIFVKSVGAINQAKFSLAPPDLLPRVGETFSVNITLDTDGADVKNADAVLTFDPAKLSVVALTPGQLFDSYPTKSFDAAGNIKLSGAMTVATASYSGVGKFGSISLKGISAGTTTVAFTCTPGVTTDSNITQILSNTDVLDCTKLIPISLTIAKAIGAPSPEATPTPPPAADLTPTFFLTLAGIGLVAFGSLNLFLGKKYYD